MIGSKSSRKMKKAEVKILRNDKQQIKDNLVLKEGKVYVSKNKSLKLEIIWLHYNILITEHRGQQKIVELVTKIIGGQKLQRK